MRIPPAFVLFPAAGVLHSTAYLPIWHSYNWCCDLSGRHASGMHFICAALWTWTASAADCSEPLQHFGACISALLCFRASNIEYFCFMLCSLHQGLSFNRTISALRMMGACCISCAHTRPEMNLL